MKVRVRYAPSPTGYLHIGNARTAVFNYLFAKHNQGKFIVRIEDTDLERNIADGISSQLDNLRWLGLSIDESVDIGGPFGPYKQSERLKTYSEYAKKLIEVKNAYYCFCNSITLDKMRLDQAARNIQAFQYDGRCSLLNEKEIAQNLSENIPCSIRVKIPENEEYIVEDLVRGTIKFHSKDMGDYVIIKSNGVPTYNFAVVIDDYLMKISHILRGAEHLSNTPKQIVIYKYFNWPIPLFGHLTLIVNETGKKLSKRDGHLMQFIHQYRDIGFLPDAIINFISLLGWSPHEEREIYNLQELINIFNSDYFSKGPSMFDINKLLWMNNHYIKNLSKTEYLNLVTPFVKTSYQWKLHDNLWWEELLLIFQKQLNYGEEIITLISLFFKEPKITDLEALEMLKKHTSTTVLKEFLSRFNELSDINEFAIKNIFNQIKKNTKISGQLLFMPIRIVSTGQMEGPELPKTIKLLGKSTVIKRLEEYISKFNNESY